MYVVAQYLLFILCKIVSVVITNRLESMYEEKKAAQLGGLN